MELLDLFILAIYISIFIAINVQGAQTTRKKINLGEYFKEDPYPKTLDRVVYLKQLDMSLVV